MQSRKRHKPQRAQTARKKGYRLKLAKAKARERTIKGWKTKWMKQGGRKVGPQKFGAKKLSAKELEVRKRRLFGIEEEGGGWNEVTNSDDETPVFTRTRRSMSPKEELDELGQAVGQRQGWSHETTEGLKKAQEKYLAEGTFLGLEGVASRKQIREKLKKDLDLSPEELSRLDDNTIDMFVEGLQKQSERQFLLKVADELIGHDPQGRPQVPSLLENYASLQLYKRLRDQEEPQAVPPRVRQLATDIEDRNMDVAGPGTTLKHAVSILTNPDIRRQRPVPTNAEGGLLGVSRKWSEADRAKAIKDALGINTSEELLKAAQEGKIRNLTVEDTDVRVTKEGEVIITPTGKNIRPFNASSEAQIVENLKDKSSAELNEEISPDDVKYRVRSSFRNLPRDKGRDQIAELVYGSIMQTRDPMTDMGNAAAKKLQGEKKNEIPPTPGQLSAGKATSASAVKEMPITYGPLGEPLRPRITETSPGEFTVTYDYATTATASGGRMKDVPIQRVPLARVEYQKGKRILGKGKDPKVEQLINALTSSNYGETKEIREKASRDAQRLAGQLGIALDTAYETRLEQAATEIARRHFLHERQQVAGEYLQEESPLDPRFGQFGKPSTAEDYYDPNLQPAHIGPETTGTPRLNWETKNLLAKAQGKNYYAPKPQWFQAARSHMGVESPRLQWEKRKKKAEKKGEPFNEPKPDAWMEPTGIEPAMAANKIEALKNGNVSAFFNYERGRGVVPGGRVGSRGEKNPIENADFSITPNFLREYTLNEINTRAEANTVYPNDPKAGYTGRKLGEIRGWKGDQTVRYEQIPGEERKMVLEPWNFSTQFKEDELQTATDSEGNVLYDETGRPQAKVREIPRFDTGALHMDPGVRVPIDHQPSKDVKEVFIERPYEVVQQLRQEGQDVTTLPGRSRETHTEYYRLDYPTNPDEQGSPDRVRIDREEYDKLPDVKQGDLPNKATETFNKNIKIKYVAPGETMLAKDQSDVGFLTLGRGKFGTKYGYNIGVRLDEDADSRAADVARLAFFEPMQHLQTIKNEPIEQGVSALHQIETVPREGDAKTLDTLRSEIERAVGSKSGGAAAVEYMNRMEEMGNAGFPEVDQKTIERIASNPQLQDQVKKEYGRRYGVDERTAENNLKTLIMAAGSAGVYKGRKRIFGEGGNLANKAVYETTKRLFGEDKAVDQVFDAYKVTGRRSAEEWVYDIHNVGAALRHPFSSLSGRASPIKVHYFVPDRLLSPTARELRNLQDQEYQLSRLVTTAEKNAAKAEQPGLLGMLARDRAKFVKKHIEKRAAEVAEVGEGATGPMGVFDKALRDVADLRHAEVQTVPQEGRGLIGWARRAPKPTNATRERLVVKRKVPYQSKPIDVEITRPVQEAAATLGREIKGDHGLGERLVKVNKQLGRISDGSIPAPPVFPNASRWFKGGFTPTEKHVLIGAGVVGTAAGAAYLYHRHQEKKRKEADPTYQGKTWYNKVLPPTFKSPVPKPSWQTTKTYTVPGTEFTNYFQFSGNEIPVGGRLHFNRPEVTLRPMEKKDVVGNTYSPTAGLGLLRIRGGKSKGALKGLIVDPETHEAYARGRKSFVPQGKEIEIFGKKTPFWIDVGKEKKMKITKTNKYRMSDKDRESLIASVYGTPQEQAVRDFFTFGTHDKVIDMMNDPDEVARIFRSREQKQLTKQQFKKQQERAKEAGVYEIDKEGTKPTPEEKIEKLEGIREEMKAKGELTHSMDAAISDAQREIKAKKHAYPDIPGEYPIPWMGASFGSRSDIIHQEVTDSTRRIEPREQTRATRRARVEQNLEGQGLAFGDVGLEGAELVQRPSPARDLGQGVRATQVDEQYRLHTIDTEGGSSPEIIRRTGPEVNKEQMQLFSTPHVDAIDLEAREAVKTDTGLVSGRRGSPRKQEDAFKRAQNAMKKKYSKQEARDPAYDIKDDDDDLQDKFEGGIGFA